MTPATLERIGKALFGDRWQTQLAIELGVSARTMRRWLAGDFAMPELIAHDLEKLIVLRRRELARVLDVIEAAA